MVCVRRSEQGCDLVGKEPDEQLAHKAQQGSDTAYSLLISRYVSFVKSRVFGYRDSDVEPEDLAQEGMIGLMMAIRSYREGLGASFRTYAGLCIDRAIISAVRATLRAKAVPSSSLIPFDDLEEGRVPVDPEKRYDPESALLASEEKSRLRERFSRVLSELELDVLMLHLGGCNYNEISSRLGSSPKAVDNALQRARRKLKQHW